MKKNSKKICIIISVFITSFVVAMVLSYSDKLSSDNTNKEANEKVEETSNALENNEPSIEDVSKYVVVSGIDDEYGFYYEVQLNDSSSIRYYESDGLYEVVEQTDTSTTIETPDYYLVIYEDGSEVKIKEQDKDVVILDENGGPYLIGVYGD